MCRRIFVILFCAACCASTAAAGPMRLRIESINGIVIDDNGSGDLADLADGTIVAADSIAPFVGISLAATSDPSASPLGGLEIGRLTLDVVVISMGAGSITYVLEDSNYSPGPFATGIFSVDVSGVLTGADSSSIVVESWLNPHNLAPDLGTSVHPVGSLDPFGGIPAGSLEGLGGVQSFGVGAFAVDNSANPVNVTFNGAYSLFSRVTVNMTGAGMAAFTLSGTVAGEPTATPEPTTLAMAIMGCLPLAYASSRRLRCRRRHSEPARCDDDPTAHRA